MKPRSRKAKGRKHQNWVRDLILSLFPELHKDDVKSAVMGESGEDIKLSPQARKYISYAIECKADENISVWRAWDQAKANSGDYNPCVVMTKNRSDKLVIIEAKHFFELLRQLNG